MLAAPPGGPLKPRGPGRACRSSRSTCPTMAGSGGLTAPVLARARARSPREATTVTRCGGPHRGHRGPDRLRSRALALAARDISSSRSVRGCAAGAQCSISTIWSLPGMGRHILACRDVASRVSSSRSAPRSPHASRPARSATSTWCTTVSISDASHPRRPTRPCARRARGARRRAARGHPRASGSAQAGRPRRAGDGQARRGTRPGAPRRRRRRAPRLAGVLREPPPRGRSRCSATVVRFVGPRDDVPDVLRALDVLVNASVAEPFGLTLVEAQACGTPVVAMQSGGAPETVIDGETGFVVPAGDEAAARRGDRHADRRRRADAQRWVAPRAGTPSCTTTSTCRPTGSRRSTAGARRGAVRPGASSRAPR